MQKDILLHSARLLISKLIPAILLTLINVIYSRELSQSDYGAYHAVWSYLSVCVVFTSFGIPQYILSQSSRLNKPTIKRIAKASLLIVLGLLLLINLYMVFYSGFFGLYTLLFFNVLLLSQSFYFIQEAMIISGGKSGKLFFSSSLYALMLFLVHMLALFFFRYNLSTLIALIAFVAVVRNIFLLRSFLSRIGEYRLLMQRPEANDIGLLFWLGLNGFLQVITKWIDKFILLFWLPLAEFAIYYNGTWELPLIGMVLMAFATIITYFGAKETEGDDKVVTMFGSTSLFMSAMLFPLFSLLFLYSESVVTLLFGSRYENSSSLFALSSLLLPVRICNYTVLLQLKNKGSVILKGSFLDFLLSLLLMAALYPLWKLNGLVLAFVISTYLQATYYLYQISRIYRVALSCILPFQKLLIRLFVSFLVIWGIKKLTFGDKELSLFLASLTAFILFLSYCKDILLLVYKKEHFSKKI